MYIYNENKTINLFFYIKVIMIYMAYINNEKQIYLPSHFSLNVYVKKSFMSHS